MTYVVTVEVRGRAQVTVEAETEAGAYAVARTMGEWDFDWMEITDSEPLEAKLVEDA